MRNLSMILVSLWGMTRTSFVAPCSFLPSFPLSGLAESVIPRFELLKLDIQKMIIKSRISRLKNEYILHDIKSCEYFNVMPER